MPKPSFKDRLAHAWDVFTSGEDSTNSAFYQDTIQWGRGSTERKDRARMSRSVERSITASLYNRLAMDVASVPIKHVKVNQNGRFEEVVKSGLQNCLSVEANIDQTGRELIFDAVLTMFNDGYVAIVPVETSVNPRKSNSYDILSMRTAKIVEWYPESVKLDIYNEKIGETSTIVLPKRQVAIVENPFYSVMNEKNSTIQRLIEKLNLLDAIDKQSGSSKLDLLIRLPYALKTPAKKKQAEDRKKDIEDQLENSKYGIAYIDSTENVTQLNRPIDNNLMSQIEFLTTQVYSQMGITKEVFEGTANEEIMLNYHNNAIEPILSAITDEMIRKFLTKTARSQGQSIKFIRDPFRLTPVQQISEIADKFTRNEILSSNEVRAIVGYKPVDDVRADELRNRNLNASQEQLDNPVTADAEEDEYYEEGY